MAIIQANNLTKKFGEFTAVSNLNISIKKGELTAYLGSNGAGKSTTIAMLIGTLDPTAGEILYEGKNLKNVSLKKIKIGVVFQNSILDHELTVRQNLKIRAALNGKYSQKWLDMLMKQTGVIQFANRKYGELSGGMKRKVDITRALLNHPKILFLDEPTTGLDVQSRQEIWQLLNELKEKQQLSIFLTTHYLEEAENADNVYIINHGKIVEHGSAQELKEKYIHSKLHIITKKTIQKNKQIKKIADKEYIINCQNEKTAFEFLKNYQNDIKYFSYMPVKISDVFIKLIKEEQ